MPSDEVKGSLAGQLPRFAGSPVPRSLQNAHASLDTNRKRKQSRELASFATECDYLSSKPAIKSEDGVGCQAQSASKIQQK